MLGRFLRRPGGATFRRERLETPDGDFIDVDWGPDPSPHAPIVLILHGLEGSSRRSYVRNVARELLDAQSEARFDPISPTRAGGARSRGEL